MKKEIAMNKEKRNIATKLETESKYLTNILDKEDVKEFKKLIPELQDTWHQKTNVQNRNRNEIFCIV